MRYFWTKVIYLVLIAAILVGYQVYAHSLADSKSGLSQRELALQERGGFKDGAYSGTADGYQGPITVQVLVQDGQILSIEITDTKDDPAYLKIAETMIDEILRRQTLDGIDTVSGATFSSTGILNAAKQALEGAGS